MLELHSSSEGEIARDPYDRPLDEQLGNFGNPYDKVIELLERIANFSERQREKSAPDIIDLSATAGLPIAGTFQLKTSLRIMGILISGGTAGHQLRFSVGGRNWNFYIGTNTATFFPFPYTAMAGNDMAATDITGGGAAFSFLVFGYPE